VTRHPSAVVDTPRVGDGVVIGAFCVIGPDVTVHDGVVLHPHVVISGTVEIGAGTSGTPGLCTSCHTLRP
jgi:UDP-N-acetylglucosamine acyltransferase